MSPYPQQKKSPRRRTRDGSYCITTLKVYPSSEEPTRIIYSSSRARKPQRDPRVDKTHPKKRRKATSLMTGCAFQVCIKKQRGQNVFQVEDIPLERLVHNHPKAPMHVYLTYRRGVLESLREQATARCDAGETPTRASNNLKSEHPEAKHLTVPDMRNFFASHRRDGFIAREMEQVQQMQRARRQGPPKGGDSGLQPGDRSSEQGHEKTALPAVRVIAKAGSKEESKRMVKLTEGAHMSRAPCLWVVDAAV